MIITGDVPFLTDTALYIRTVIPLLFSEMDTDPTAANYINRLEHSSPNALAAQLPLLFEKILDPDQDSKLTYSYVVRFRRSPPPITYSEPARPPSSPSEEFSFAKDRRLKTRRPLAMDSVGSGRLPWMQVLCLQ